MIETEQVMSSRQLESKDFGSDNTPFFILGCVRSGTTMLRDLLRLHPRLECPEETHFFRWADPFASPRYDRNYIAMKIFDRHRKMDGISNMSFHAAKEKANNRKEISDLYGQLYLDARANSTGRWFDKTPQNVYGVFLIGHMYPHAKFVHIHRHPLNVVASLVEGKVMARHSVKGAVNYWMESMILLNEFKKNNRQRILELPYETLVSNPLPELQKLCIFIGEDPSLLDANQVKTHEEQNNYRKVLTVDEQRYVLEQTAPFLSDYGYAS
jgi:hypothetical protein